MLVSADDDYMKMKLESFKKAHQPVRFVKQLDRVVQNYKPVANHKNLVRECVATLNNLKLILYNSGGILLGHSPSTFVSRSRPTSI